MVLATQRLPLLGLVYRGIYKAAADAVADLATRNREIAGIYARNSYALGTWEPGRSDIDLTVAWHHPTEDAIGRFYSAYAGLRKRFPMLGEIEMIDACHLGAWTRHGISGLHCKDWKTLAGEKPQSHYRGDEALDRIRYAVSVYRYQFLKYFWQRPRDKQTLQRAAAKLMKALGQAPSKERDSNRLLALCLSEISRAVEATRLPVDEPYVDYGSLIGDLPRSSRRLTGETSLGEGVLSVLTSSRESAARHVLVDPGVDFTEVIGAYPRAVFWDRPTFHFYLCFVDPLEYFLLLRERIFQGDDPLRELFALSRVALRDTVCHYTADMLTYPYQPQLISLSNDEFQNVLYAWFLRTLRYFEQEVIDFDYGSLRRYFGDRYDESGTRFSQLHMVGCDLSRHLSLESFAANSSHLTAVPY